MDTPGFWDDQPDAAAMVTEHPRLRGGWTRFGRSSPTARTSTG